MYEPMVTIWNTQTLPKIRVFAWKMATNALSVKTNLARRGVMVQLTCPMCDLTETTEHLIWGCRWVEMLGLQDAGDGCNTMND